MGEDERKPVSKFLKEFKEIATKDRGIDVIGRRKNIQSLANLGLTKRNRKDEILSLSVKDYCDGPKPDRDRPGELWEFGKTIDAKEVYIKLKIAQVGNKKIAKCLSFHVAEFPLRFPFRDFFKKGGDEK